MREYKWRFARWLTDNHSWVLMLDIPQLSRDDTGEVVSLQPQPFPSIPLIDVGPGDCKIYYVPEANIYIALAENAYRKYSVLFYDMVSLKEEYHRRFPGMLFADD